MVYHTFGSRHLEQSDALVNVYQALSNNPGFS